ncbi:MAG: hypothetical protein JW726_00700 [Anaerolineales bacterium]|nr:hypothetical protein [Anaerolineales bacterium]
MNLISKSAIKGLLGEIPLTAEMYWLLRQPGKPLSADFSLQRLQKLLPAWVAQAQASPLRKQPGKRIFTFGMMRYWIEHVTLLGMSLAGLGHQVTLSYLPYGRWNKPIDRFNLRRQNMYARTLLEQAQPLLKVKPLLTVRKGNSLPEKLERAVEMVALRDTQYTLQVEEVNQDSELYRLRLERDREAAQAAFALLQKEKPEQVLLPNGTILEFGVIYQVAKYLGIPIITYEFGEQQKRIWLAHNGEVMRQNTDDLWDACQDRQLNEEQWAQVKELFASRQRASLWQNFAMRWQGVPSEGGAKVRQTLGLDDRPIVLLATNVIGDSLTLGRQVFSDTMTGWLESTVQFFANKPDVQFVARIHPGELITKGPSVADVVKRVLPNPPEHIHLVAADAKINTYDLVEIADLGLVYTTTAGLEMAMSGLPVIAVGNTHYRGKGFTLDPQTWEEYYQTLNKVLEQPAKFRLSKEQVERAWQYAYYFFFHYPQPFPWHLLHMRNDLEEWSMGRVLSQEGQALFGKTLNYLAGEPIEW